MQAQEQTTEQSFSGIGTFESTHERDSVTNAIGESVERIIIVFSVTLQVLGFRRLVQTINNRISKRSLFSPLHADREPAPLCKSNVLRESREKIFYYLPLLQRLRQKYGVIHWSSTYTSYTPELDADS